MNVIEFVQNYDDLSTDEGFQFRFFCDHCRNGYMSSFQKNKIGIAGGFLRAAGDMLGGVFAPASNTAFDIQRAVGGTAHDSALRQAVDEIKPLFVQCHRCGSWVCSQVCWNDEKSLCKQCAPILMEELASAQAQAAKVQLEVQTLSSNQTQGVSINIPARAFCAQCGAAATPGKFCAECGAPYKTDQQCAKCHASVKAGSKFCAECGTPLESS